MGDFGALPFIYGTVVTSAVALMVAVPLGVWRIDFSPEFAPPRISNTLPFSSTCCGRNPSVIYGLLGVFL